MECWSIGVLIRKMENPSLFIEIHHSSTPMLLVHGNIGERDLRVKRKGYFQETRRC
jgi:hypothetical protein